MQAIASGSESVAAGIQSAASGVAAVAVGSVATATDLVFQVVDGQWKLFGISVATPEAPADLNLESPARPRS